MCGARLGGGDDEWLAELAVELPPEHVEVVGGRGRVHDLPVVLLRRAHLPLERVQVGGHLQGIKKDS